MAEITVKNILSKDKRIFQDKDGQWHARSLKTSESLGKLPFVEFTFWGSRKKLNRYTMYRSGRYFRPKLIWEAWTKTESLSFEDRQPLISERISELQGKAGGILTTGR